MRPPLEYGDNFPVTAASWNPTIPWRFPRSEGKLQRRSFLDWVLPWVALGLGVTLGVWWMSWRMELPDRGSRLEPGPRSGRQEEVLRPPSVAPAKAAPAAPPARLRSRVA